MKRYTKLVFGFMLGFYSFYSYASVSDLFKSSDLESAFSSQDAHHSAYRAKAMEYKRFIFEKSKILRCDADKVIYLFHHNDKQNKAINLHFFSLNDSRPNLVLGMDRSDYEKLSSPTNKMTDKHQVFETAMLRNAVAPVDRGVNMRTVMADSNRKVFWIDSQGEPDIARQFNIESATLYSRIDEYGQDQIYKTSCRVLKD